jgi:S-adenosylmethionine:tRNA ribosyltransferase-isomerase
MAAPLLTADFEYHLPEELIASRPLAERDASRMMVVHRSTGKIEHRQFREFPEFARDYLLVLNNTRVAKARFFSNDGRIEILRLQALEERCWLCLVKPGKKMRVGDSVQLGEATGVVESIQEPDGARVIRFDQAVDEARLGHLALPHYMNRSDDDADEERYQTVYAAPDKERAIAAPTAGLHFTPAMLAELPHTFVTLDVGIGTFKPVKAEEITDHQMHVEQYEITPEAAAAITASQRVLAVGTTVTRVLEHVHRTHQAIVPGAGETGIFLYPGVSFHCISALLTNFHLPKSTLFMLVCALGGTDLLKEAYCQAIAERYRFFSYGDCMLIL